MPSRIYDCLDPQGRKDGIDAAVKAVRAGQCVVLPTDTVYGIGVDAFNPDAVAKLLATKRRGPDMPCLLYTSPSPRDRTRSRMPSSA